MAPWSSVRRLWIGAAVLTVGVSAATAAVWQVQRTRPVVDKYHDADGNPWPMKSEKRMVTLGPDSPDEALRWKQMFERDDDGNLSPDGLMNARRQLDRMKADARVATAALTAAGVEPPSIAGIATNGWTWAGPGNIGGRTRAIAVHPADSNTIFAGSVAGGIWKTTDGGASWNIVDDFMTNLAISSIVFKPGNPNVMFAGTGEGFSNADAIRGAGIFRSTNGGTTWTQLPNTANSNFFLVNELAFSPDGTTLMAAAGTGFWRSTDDGDNWSQRRALTSAQDVKFIPGSNTQVVFGGRTHNAMFSTDGGVTIQDAAIGTIGGSNNRVELAVSPSQPEVVYASIAAGGTLSTPPAEIWKSTDFGVNYTMVNNQASSLLGAQGWYDNAIFVDPVNANNVIVGGVSLFRSLDGGVTFASLGGSIHSDQHVIVADPGYNGTSNKRIFFGNDGGVFKAESLTFGVAPTMTVLNNNYGVTQFYGGDGLVSTGRLFGGTQDNGTLTYTGNPQGWTPTAGADGGMATADQVSNFLYGETQNLGVHRSNNGAGATTITGCSGSTPVSPNPLLDTCNGTVNFISPLLLDPNNPDRLLAGGANLWVLGNPRTATNTTVSWANIKASIGSNITAIAVAKGNSDIIWVGHGNGDIFVTFDGSLAAPTWNKRDPALPFPNRAVSSINVDPADPATAYVSFGGFLPGNLWVTHDSGGTWADITGTGGGQLPAVPIRWVVPHPTIANWLYVATDVGIFASENGGTTWQVPHEGPSNVAVFQVFFVGTRLVAATHGRGMFFVDIAAPNTPPSISTQPLSQSIGSGQTATLSVGASGTAPLTFQWFQGTSPNTASPIGGATSSSFTTPALSSTTSYWVRVTNGFGTADSNTATITIDLGISLFNSTLKAPKCANVVNSCDTGPVAINGRGTGSLAGGTEPNSPNTINNSCADGTSPGNYHVDESIDRLKVSTLDATPFAAGKTVKIDATVFVFSTTSDKLDLFFAANANAPVWTLIGTVTPGALGIQTLSMNYTLPPGGLQAIRANYRFGGAQNSCTTGGFDDHDDLIFAVNPANNTELIQNGNFASGLSNWFLFEVPDIVHNNAAGGVFQYHKANPTTTGSGQAVVFQETGVAVGSDTALTAQFDIGNTDNIRKRISVLVLDSNFSDLSVCTFWLPASAPLATYQMKTHPTRGWANASIYFYVASTNTSLPAADYQLDNVSLKTDAASSLTRTECIEPVGVRPTPPGGGAGPNLLTNGDFGTGVFAPWGPFNDIQFQVSGGVFEFFRPGTPGLLAGGVLQTTGQAMALNEIMTATFQLGNSSSVRKRVTVLLHDLDFSDLSACTFFLPPGTPLSNFAIRSRPTKAWANATISFYAATTGTEQWIRLDNVSLNRTPGASQFLGTECFEPGSAPTAANFGDERGNFGSPGISLSSSSAGGAGGWSGSGGFAPVSGATGAGTSAWGIEAASTSRSILGWADSIDLAGATSAALSFDSLLSSNGSAAAVQVSLDGVTWQTVRDVLPDSGWTTIGVNLSAYAGHHIYLRFIFDGVAPPFGVSPDTWRIEGVTIVRNGG